MSFIMKIKDARGTVGAGVITVVTFSFSCDEIEHKVGNGAYENDFCMK